MSVVPAGTKAEQLTVGIGQKFFAAGIFHLALRVMDKNITFRCHELAGGQNALHPSMDRTEPGVFVGHDKTIRGIHENNVPSFPTHILRQIHLK